MCSFYNIGYKVWIKGRICIKLPLTVAGNDSQERSEKLGWREKVEEVELKTTVSAEVQLANLHRLHLVTNCPPSGILYLEKNYIQKETLDKYNSGVYWSDFVSLLYFLKKLNIYPKRSCWRVKHSTLLSSSYTINNISIIQLNLIADLQLCSLMSVGNWSHIRDHNYLSSHRIMCCASILSLIRGYQSIHGEYPARCSSSHVCIRAWMLVFYGCVVLLMCCMTSSYLYS